MNKTIEGFQINNNVGFGSEALNAEGRRIAQQRGFSTDNPATASDPSYSLLLFNQPAMNLELVQIVRHA